MTRTRSIFKLEEVHKNQERIVEENPKKVDLKRKKKVSDVESEEFVKMLKGSEYSMVSRRKLLRGYRFGHY